MTIIDHLGCVGVSSLDAIDYMYRGGELSDIEIVDNNEYTLYQNALKYFDQKGLDKFNLYKENDEDIASFDQKRQEKWLIPDHFLQLNLLEYLHSKCKTKEEQLRVNYELTLFEKNNAIIIIRLFIFLIDHFRRNEIVWGVGRGSSCSSFILYLIGVHKVDPIKYNLDIKDFFKEN